MRHDDEGAEAPVLDEVDSTGEAVDPRMIPRDGKRDRRVEQHAEVVAVVRALVEVPEVGDEPAAESLLDAQFHLVALAWRNRLAVAEEPVQADAGATAAGSRCTAFPSSGRRTRAAPFRLPAPRTTRPGAAERVSPWSSRRSDRT